MGLPVNKLHLPGRGKSERNSTSNTPSSIWNRGQRSILGFFFGFSAIALATLALKALRFEEYSYSVVLVYIVLVLVTASYYGLLPGLVTSLLGFVCFDFFFISPFFTLYIDSLPGLVAVLSFLGAATITSQIAANARNKTAEALLRQEETAALNELNIAVLSEGQTGKMLERVVQQVADNLQAREVAIYLPAPIELKLNAVFKNLALEENVGEIFSPVDLQLAFKKGKPRYKQIETGRLAFLPLLQGGESLGIMAVLLERESQDDTAEPVFKADTLHWLEILANQASLAVAHARLIAETAQVASLREADRLKSALLASISHELRTPLTAIKTAVQGLQDEGVEQEEQAEYYTIIDQEADRLSRLISNMLDISRIEAGTLRPNKGLHFLPEIINNAIERLTRSGIMGEHGLTTNFQPDLPLVAVDYLQIDQVIANLLENAAKYSPPNTPIYVNVYQAERAGEPGLAVEVVDEGIGVAEAERERIFDKFYRVWQDEKPGKPSRVSGSGLGLAICKGIIEAHGGFIEARPRLYGGSIFYFWLPVNATRLRLKKEEQ
ncbi:MAG TPA: ATP-binding protein [Chloroflexia bacterium]|nr:ATP-binding protein [Chloroflexia bacterium]